MSRQFWLLITVLIVATAIYHPFSPSARQSRNMELADRHIAVLKPKFGSDPRFADIELMSFTGEGGSLLVLGDVASQAYVDAADQIVKQSLPPCPVVFRVRIRPATAPTALTSWPTE